MYSSLSLTPLSFRLKRTTKLRRKRKKERKRENKTKNTSFPTDGKREKTCRSTFTHLIFCFCFCLFVRCFALNISHMFYIVSSFPRGYLCARKSPYALCPVSEVSRNLAFKTVPVKQGLYCLMRISVLFFVPFVCFDLVTGSR